MRSRQSFKMGNVYCGARRREVRGEKEVEAGKQDRGSDVSLLITKGGMASLNFRKAPSLKKGGAEKRLSRGPCLF